MREISHGACSAALPEEPAYPLANLVWNGFEFLCRHCEVVADSYSAGIEKGAKYTSAVKNRFEIDEFQDLLAGLAMKGQADQSLPDLNDRAGGKVVQAVAIDDHVFAKVAVSESAICGDGFGCKQNLTEWRTSDILRDAVRTKFD